MQEPKVKVDTSAMRTLEGELLNVINNELDTINDGHKVVTANNDEDDEKDKSNEKVSNMVSEQEDTSLQLPGKEHTQKVDKTLAK